MARPSLLKSTLFLLLISFGVDAVAKNLAIFDVRKNIAMSDEEKVYRDFYINGGTAKGLRTGMVVTVTRRKALNDVYKSKDPGDLILEVGRLKIIHAQSDMSVAREFDIFDRADRPILEDNFFLVGDKIDPKSAVMESQIIKKSEEKTAQKAPKPKLAPKRQERDFASRIELEPMPDVDVPAVQ